MPGTRPSGLIDVRSATQVGRAILAMANSAETTAMSAWQRPPASGFAAGLYIDGSYTSAVSQMSVSVASGLDHLRALGHALQLHDALATSLGTIARGAVESLGRAWWMLSSDTPLQCRHRAALLLAKEGQGLYSRGLMSTNSVGEHSRTTFDATLHSALIDTTDEGSATDMPTFSQFLSRAPGFTKLATDVLDATGINGAVAYSRLSGIAHGESMHLMARGVSTGPTTAGLAQTYEWVTQVTRYPLDVLHVTIELLVQRWGTSGDAEEWQRTRDRSFDQIGAVLDAR
jgi:hypothetical protein